MPLPDGDKTHIHCRYVSLTELFFLLAFIVFLLSWKFHKVEERIGVLEAAQIVETR